MSKWQEKRLGDIISIKHGFAFKGEYISDEANGKVLVTPGNFNIGGGFKKTDKKFYYGEIPQDFILKPKDLIITMTDLSKNADTIGYSALIPNDNNIYLHNQRIGLVSVLDSNIDKHFIYWVLRTSSYQRQIANTSNGTNVKHTSPNRIYSYKCSIPDLATQEKIADILSTYDDLIENNNRRIEILGQMAQEIYKEWFVRFRFPGHEKVKFKSIKMTNWIIGDKTIFMIPYSWNIGNVNELAIFQRGSNLTSANMINGNIPVISAGIQPSGYHNNANVFGQSITVSASGANAGYLLYHLNNIWASDCSYLQSEYIWFIYNTLKFLQPVLSNLQCGAAQPHVYPKQINKISIIIPTNEILKQYCSKVEPIYEYIKNLKEKNQNLIKQRDLLLPRLMSGKLEV